jgi:hypothetical protein
VASSPCVDRSAVGDVANEIGTHLEKAVSDLKSFDVQSAVSELRIASADAHSISDKFSDVDSAGSAALGRVADGLDQAATALNIGDVENATSYLQAAVEELNNLGSLTDHFEPFYC